MTRPKLTVIMPNYNHGHHLSTSLEAIVNQSYTSREILFVDDASTDNSIEIVHQYQKKYPEIRIIHHKTNQGPIAGMNTGLREAKGDYIALCSADDEVLPGYFEESIALLEEFPKSGACTSRFSYFYEDRPDKIYQTFNIPQTKPTYFSPRQVFASIAKYNFWVPSNCSILRRSAMKEFDSRLWALCDWYLCHEIAFRYGICYLPKHLSLFRQAPAGYSQKSKQSNAYEPLLRLLKEDRDLKPFFLKSGILFQLDKEIFPFLLVKPAYWPYIPRIFKNKVKQKFAKLKRESQM